MLSFIPIMKGMHKVWQRLSRNFGVPGCAGILWDALSPSCSTLWENLPQQPQDWEGGGEIPHFHRQGL